MNTHLDWMTTPEGALTLTVPPAFFSSHEGQRTSIALDNWIDRGLATTDGENPPRQITLAPALWEALRYPVEEADAELREAFDALLATRPATWHLKSESFVGAPRLDVAVTRDGIRVELPESPALVGAAGLEPLTPEVFVLLRTLREWNARPAHSKAAQLRLVSTLQELAEQSATTSQDIVLDAHLASFKIIHPKSIGLAWEPSARRPELHDLRAEMRDDDQPTPVPLESLDSQEPVVPLGDKSYAVLDDDTAAALRHVRSRHQGRSHRDVARVVRDAAGVLPPGIAPDSIDLSEYSHRITGFERVARASRSQDIQSSGVRWFEDEPASEDDPFLTLEITSDPSAPPTKVVFDTPDEAESARSSLENELRRPAPAAVHIGGAEVIPTQPLRDRLDLELSIHKQGRKEKGEEAPVEPPPRLAAVIDEDAVFDSVTGRELLGATPWSVLEGLLAPGIVLKSHQREGVTWLWNHLRKGAPGVLLADDMGLGKTLQVACLLALHRAHDTERRPSLIVLPLVLIENWLAEFARFFRPEAIGSVVVLHGEGLRSHRIEGGLDLEALQGADLVITNYDTLARYQVDLLKIDWRTVVVDEAHGIKNPDALRTRAACGLKRQFSICMTGTPVENRLLDLWTLFFFMSPRDPFGTRQEFEGLSQDGSTRSVREALQYPSIESRVLRRSKKVLDLPPKELHEHLVPMSGEQVALERSIGRAAGTGPEGALKALNQLRKLYAHPWLLHEVPPERWSIADAISASPKFQACLDELERVHRAGEKALIFSISIPMQALLARVVRERFGLRRVHVINGEANLKGRTGQMLEDFRRSAGFDVLVLSPIAAGVGLNITAANHVIHYERWWNPAKEDQATDRAYRIGQTKPVHVHQLLLHHPGSPQTGFDMKLHELITAKRNLARDFLSPADGLELQPGDILRAFEGSN